MKHHKLNLRQAWVACLALAAALLATACSDGGEDDGPAPAPTVPLNQACAAYKPASLPHGATLVKTELRAASGFLPQVCIVRGQIVSGPSSTINWAVELPSRDAWNQKTLTIGGGGADGFIPTDDDRYQQMVGPSAVAFVKISSDSGHQVPSFYPWATDEIALRNHAYQANHFVLGVGTAIATEFYGRAPARRYMFGHSNGGRSGLAAAQRYPADYDGIISLAPAINQQAHQANVGPTVVRHIYSSPANWLNAAKVQLYANAELAACDELDGLKDGIIGNAAACNYVPNDLLCAGADSDTCLTAGQIETIRLVHADKTVPVLMSNGLIGYPRYGRGGAATSDWAAYMFGSAFAARNAFNFFIVDDAVKAVTRDPNASVMTIDPVMYQPQFTQMTAILDSTDPDLRAFADRGGKLLIWYGIADSCVSAYRTADYFDSVKRVVGESTVSKFARFFVSPGTGHNMDGPGPAKLDWVKALDEWVEKSVAPDNLVASKMNAAGTAVEIQRPLCPYPQFPRYKGVGDSTKADSFTCAAS